MDSIIVGKILKRKICVVTSSRADYGLLFPLLKKLQTDPDVELQIVATGMHLSPQFGQTYKAIENDGFKIDAYVDMLLANDTPNAITKSMGLGSIAFADTLERLKPDLLTLLGDRFEILAVAQAAMIAGIPIAHIHGGELTEAAFDDSVRHCITKMSHLHFVCAEAYKKRVIQLGEQPDRVFNWGAPGLETLSDFTPLSRNELENDLKIKFRKQNFLVTVHPTTLEQDPSARLNEGLYRALEAFPEAGVIFTGTNADTSNRSVDSMIRNFVSQNADRVSVFTSLGSKRYLSLMKHVDLVLGNSSSGIFEAPIFGVPTVNVGMRQHGRLRCESIIDCGVSKEEIESAIRKALSPEFLAVAKKAKSPYGMHKTSENILQTMKTVDLNTLTHKRFYDVN